MTTQQTAVQRYRRGPGASTRSTGTRPKSLPEYLEAQVVDAIIHAASNSRAALLFLVQWRVGGAGT